MILETFFLLFQLYWYLNLAEQAFWGSKGIIQTSTWRWIHMEYLLSR